MSNIKEVNMLLQNCETVKKESEFFGCIKERNIISGLNSNKAVEYGQTKCSAKTICNVFNEGDCTDYPCPGYVTDKPLDMIRAHI